MESFEQKLGMPEHLLADVANRIPPRFGASSPNDVFLLIKAYVSDSELCQPPMAVWPGQCADQSMQTLQKIARNECPRSLVQLYSHSSLFCNGLEFPQQIHK